MLGCCRRGERRRYHRRCTAVSDYDFRGASQTAKDPAIQASLDFSTEGGWYIGAWASNVDFGPDVDADYEVDLYTGFSGGEEDGLGWDVGFIYYAYDDSDLNYPEIYGKLSYGMFSGGLFYSNDWVNSGESSLYATGDVSVPAGETELLDDRRTPVTASAASGRTWTRSTSTTRSASATRSGTSSWR